MFNGRKAVYTVLDWLRDRLLKFVQHIKDTEKGDVMGGKILIRCNWFTVNKKSSKVDHKSVITVHIFFVSWEYLMFWLVCLRPFKNIHVLLAKTYIPITRVLWAQLLKLSHRGNVYYTRCVQKASPNFDFSRVTYNRISISSSIW